MSAELMRSYLDILNENAYKQEYRAYLEQQGIEVTEDMLEEGWKSKLAAAGLAGAMALGALAPGQNASTVSEPIQTSDAMKYTHKLWDYQNHLHKKAATLAQQNPEARQDLNKLYAWADRVEKSAKAIDPTKATGGLTTVYDQTMVRGLQDLLAKYNVHPGHKGDANSMPPILKTRK